MTNCASGPPWLLQQLARVVKLNGSALGREFAAVDSARQAVILKRLAKTLNPTRKP